MSALEFKDPVVAWDDPNQFDLGNIWTPSPTGNTSSPNDGLTDHVNKGIKSVGEKTIDFFSKTADLFATGLGYYVQGKKAYDIITNPNEPMPLDPQDHSQLPSLQGTGDTSAQYANFIRLRNLLAQIKTPKKSDQVASALPFTIPAVLVAGVIVGSLILLMRAKK